MSLLDWVKRRKEGAEMKALNKKYGHEAIGAPGAASRHFQSLVKIRQGKPGSNDRPESIPRTRPSWER